MFPPPLPCQLLDAVSSIFNVLLFSSPRHDQCLGKVSAHGDFRLPFLLAVPSSALSLAPALRGKHTHVAEFLSWQEWQSTFTEILSPTDSFEL